MPAFTYSPEHPEGRYPTKSCSKRFKHEPIRQELRRKGVRKAFIGIGYTEDEIHRVKPSGLNWVSNVFPLIDAGLRRSDTEAILQRAGIKPFKSACMQCPLRSGAMWQIVARDAKSMARVAIIDEAIRNREPGCKTYLHRARVPITTPGIIDLTQTSLFDEECANESCNT